MRQMELLTLNSVGLRPQHLGYTDLYHKNTNSIVASLRNTQEAALVSGIQCSLVEKNQTLQEFFLPARGASQMTGEI